jgi:lipoprotein-anchoring transpeptidase ErfK/SrfK
MTADPAAALQALQNARQSVRTGDRRAARRWAEKAAALNPVLEEAWLILAAVASPRASVAYLERALRLNPGSDRARQGLEWARRRLEKDRSNPQAPEETRPSRLVGGTTPAKTAARPPLILRRLGTVTRSAPAKSLPLAKSLAKFRWSFIALALLLFCLVGAVAFWPGNASTALAFLRGSGSAPGFGAPADVDKPTYTATFTPTFTPTPTATSTPTFTPTFTPTDTPLPTNTPWPTSTPFQPATEVPPPPVYSSGGGVHWIDVDLSQQMLYAYEGNTIVASFLVSTGVAAFPTVVGQFHIYMKFEYTLMTGPGYYLPDVPYTMYFYRGYGIHGTYWHNNFGTPMSHGCVNMYTPDAQWLFYWAPMGTLVNVHY